MLISIVLAEVAMSAGDMLLRGKYGSMSDARLSVAGLTENRSTETNTVEDIRRMIGPGTFGAAEERQSARLPDRATWERESRFLVLEGRIRQGEGPWVVRQVPDVDHDIGAATKVLVISDSHVWGLGLHDLDQTWSRHMERELNNITHTNGYRVVNVGKPMTSFYDYAETLTPERVGKMDPDAIVIGYHLNDAIPSGNENMICGTSVKSCEVGDSKTFPAYRRCITGNDGMLGAFVNRTIQPRHPSLGAWILERYCNTDRFTSQEGLATIGDSVRDPASNPYSPLFRSATQMIMAAAKGRPVIVVPIDPQQEENGFLEILREEGMNVLQAAEMTETYELTGHRLMNESSGIENWENIQVHPADCCHFSPLYTAALGRDAARGVRSIVSPGEKKNGPIGRNIVSNFLPADLTVEQQGERVMIAQEPEDPKVEKMANDQYAACASQGRPHVQVMFDRNDVIGRRLQVTVERTTSPLLYALTGYDEENRWVTGAFRALPAGEGHTFTVDGRSTGLIIASEETGCLLDKAPQMPGFVVMVERLD